MSTGIVPTTHPMAPLTERPAWKRLKSQYEQVRDIHLRTR